MSDEHTLSVGTEASSILAAGMAMTDPHHVDGGGAYMVVPEGYRVENIERFLPAPARARGTIKAETPDSFIAYFNRFVDEKASLVFAATESFTVCGILDWHAPDGAPGFAKHQVLYEAPRSDEWKIWTGANGERMSQADFALFVENNVKDIREPDGADVLEIARQLEVKKRVEFASALRLSDGQREFTYNEHVDGATRKGQMKIPDVFKLGIPVFIGGDLYEVTARLRYRIDSGILRLWFDLLNPHEIERDAFAGIVKEIDDGVKTDVLMAVPSA